MSEFAGRELHLESLKTTIEKMNKTQHIEILKILKKHAQVVINENRNGVYINLSYLPGGAVDELDTYIHYVWDQERTIETFELQKKELHSLMNPV